VIALDMCLIAQWYIQTPNTGFILVCVSRYKCVREAIVVSATGSDIENTVFALGVMALVYSGS
jgi:hypothetical protein